MEKRITDILMNHSLIHFDVRTSFTQHSLGIVLENVDHVFIPLSENNQWVLIVVNFIDKRFDILSPEYGAGNCHKLINTVIYNFKSLFVLAFPRCMRFNIRDFEPRFVDVPKKKFRYDSGIIILRFTQTFDGQQVEHFTNSDLLPLHQKLLFQLLSYWLNKFYGKFFIMLTSTVS